MFCFKGFSLSTQGWKWRGLIGLLLIISACAQPEAQLGVEGRGVLELEISGFRNNQGRALIYLYPSARGFPEDEAPEVRKFVHEIVTQRVELQIDNLPYHAYALAVMHDENRNGQMDKNLLGVPLEGFGFSRNPTHLFGPPTFSEARFLMLGLHQKQRISIQYPKPRRLRPENAGPTSKALK